MLYDLKKISAYCGVGGFFAVVFLILSSVVHWLGLDPGYSAMFAYAILILPAYFSHKLLVFKPASVTDSLKKYIFVQLTGLLASYFIPDFFTGFGIPYILSYIAVVFFVTVVNYYSHNFWTFADENTR